MPLTPVSDLPSSITHEVVEETDHLPVYFSSPENRVCRKWPRIQRDKQCDKLTIPIHWHEYMEFIYMLDGHMTAVVQADTYELNPGDLLVINSGDLHMTRVAKPCTPYVLIQVSADRLREVFPDLDLLHFDTCIRKEKLESLPLLHSSISAMTGLHREAEDGYQLLFTARFYEFLYELYRNFSCRKFLPTTDATSRDLKRITSIVEWTRSNFRQPLTLDDAAGQLGISREYFCRIFKKYTGQTYLEYLCTTRTMNLYEELQTSDLSIPLLMEQNGLTNYKTFIRTFKELYGTTPQKLRRGTA